MSNTQQPKPVIWGLYPESKSEGFRRFYLGTYLGAVPIKGLIAKRPNLPVVREITTSSVSKYDYYHYNEQDALKLKFLATTKAISKFLIEQSINEPVAIIVADPTLTHDLVWSVITKEQKDGLKPHKPLTFGIVSPMDKNTTNEDQINNLHSMVNQRFSGTQFTSTISEGVIAAKGVTGQLHIVGPNFAINVQPIGALNTQAGMEFAETVREVSSS